jgi:hypothetical protein
MAVMRCHDNSNVTADLASVGRCLFTKAEPRETRHPLSARRKAAGRERTVFWGKSPVVQNHVLYRGELGRGLNPRRAGDLRCKVALSN